MIVSEVVPVFGASNTAAPLTINGNATRILGGASRAVLIIEEIKG